MLLDTHVLIWLSGALPMPRSAVAALEEVRARGGLLVSAVSLWEIGRLVRERKLDVRPSVRRWIEDVRSTAGVEFVPLDPEVAFDASFLPDLDHRDPADRLLIATARALDVPLATRDRAILAYAEATGAVRVLPC